MPTYTELYGIENYSDDTINNLIEANVVSFFDWGLLNIGAFTNINSGVVDGFGVDMAELQPALVEGQDDATVWQSRHMNWVWESGTKYPVIDISGVYVDSVFYPTDTSGTYSHYYDYPLGRVVFDNPVPTSSTVVVNHSFKHVDVTSYDEVNFSKLIQSDIDTHFDSSVLGSGEFDVDGSFRQQLPVIMVEVPITRKNKPFELGSLAQYRNTHVIFHLLSTDKTEVSKLMDIINYQSDKTIVLYDTNLVASGDAFPLDYRGMKKDDAKIYPTMVEPLADGGYRVQNFKSSRMRFADVVPGNIQNFNSNLFYGTVKLIGEIIL